MATVGGPRQILAFVLGYVFGGWIGITLATVITGVGAALCFILARSLAADMLHRRFGLRLERLQGVLENHTMLKVLMIRLLPVGSNLITNVLAGATNIRLLPFLTGSLIGYIPQMAVFGLLGAGIGVSDHEQLILSIVLFVVASLIGLFLYRTRYNRSVGELVAKDPSDEQPTEQSRQI